MYANAFGHENGRFLPFSGHPMENLQRRLFLAVIHELVVRKIITWNEINPRSHLMLITHTRTFSLNKTRISINREDKLVRRNFVVSLKCNLTKTDFNFLEVCTGKRGRY